MDRLEEFIVKNKSAFNGHEPSEKVWNNIQKKLPVNKSNWIWKVATVILFCTTAFLAFENYYNVPMAEEELDELETYYFSQINYKKSLVDDYNTGNYQSLNIEQDLQKLDAMYLVLKEEWKKKPSKKVLEALTLNLMVRLDVLNRHLQLIESQEEINDNRSI